MSEIKKDFKKEMQEDYPLIPMGEITDEARILAKTWYDGVSEMNNIWDKHKLASDIMNYARRFAMSPEARRMNGGWVTEKPDFTEDCLLLTASWIKSDRYWSYSLFEIKKTDGETEEGKQCWYWGIFENGDEWGDIADLRAQLYKIISALPELPVE